MRPGFAGAGSRFGAGMSRNFHGGHDFHHHHGSHDDFFFGGFGYPFFYGSYYDGYYPYGYYPYGYDPYGYGYGYGGYGYGGNGYGYDSYGQPGYRGYAAGRGSSVRETQMRLARAGYYRGAMGPRTRYATRPYQRSHSSRVTAR